MEGAVAKDVAMVTGVAAAAAAHALAQLGCSSGGEPANANSVRRPDVRRCRR
jgi:peptidyl-tRNA hydrolase